MVWPEREKVKQSDEIRENEKSLLRNLRLRIEVGKVRIYILKRRHMLNAAEHWKYYECVLLTTEEFV